MNWFTPFVNNSRITYLSKPTVVSACVYLLLGYPLSLFVGRFYIPAYFIRTLLPSIFWMSIPFPTY